MEIIRAGLERMRRSQNEVAKVIYRAVKALGGARRFLLNPRIRSQMLTRLRYREQHFQGEAATYPDRYPELFAACVRELGGLERPRILSFGCSTGEEVFSLMRYLPQAELVGVDINRWCLKQCQKRNIGGSVRFVHRLSPEFAELGGLDAIFCMAVFQRTEHRTEGAEPTDTGFTFQHFEAEVAMLDGKLKAGGLFFLDECDFSFEQTTVGERYRPVEFDGNRALRRRPLFGRDNRLITDEHSSYRCFVKQAQGW